ncbi:MAG: hypothetical protein U0X93_17020 [Anaerolineales bacterium]
MYNRINELENRRYHDRKQFLFRDNGRMAITTGFAYIRGYSSIIFAVGQPFGTLNDIFNGLAGIFREFWHGCCLLNTAQHRSLFQWNHPCMGRCYHRGLVSLCL